MPRDEIVSTMALRMCKADGYDVCMPDIGRRYERLASHALAALIEACPLVAGLIDDPEGIAGAVEAVMEEANYLYFPGGAFSDNLNHFATVSAWLTGAGEGEPTPRVITVRADYVGAITVDATGYTVHDHEELFAFPEDWEHRIDLAVDLASAGGLDAIKYVIKEHIRRQRVGAGEGGTDGNT
jgi:hypothetical protein